MTQEELIREVGKVIPNGMYSEDMIQLAFTMFNHGYQYAIDKACEWLSDWIQHFEFYTEEDVERFRKAMKGGEQ